MTDAPWLLAALFGLSLTASACSGNDSSAAPPEHQLPECTPDKATFERDVLPIVADKCAKCHGEIPDHGAPFSLERHADLVAGVTGTRIVDQMLTVLRQFQMPPPGNPQLTEFELDKLLGWASCGSTRAD
jgi:hypothetical protein